VLESLAYDVSRPAYSRELADWVLAQNGGRAAGTTLDVGCGTGRSSRWARAFSDQVHGVDASPAMIAIARQVNADPAISFGEGTAERPGVPDASMDLILCASSFEWFGQAAFAAVARRVSSPSAFGVVIVWSWLEPLDPATSQWYRLMRRILGAQVGPEADDALAMAAGFFPEPPRHRTVRAAHAYSASQLTTFVRSSSYWRDGRPDREAELSRIVRDYAARFADAGGTVRLVFREVAVIGRLA